MKNLAAGVLLAALLLGHSSPAANGAAKPAQPSTSRAAGAPSHDPVLLAAGDIANCQIIAGAEATAKIIEGIPGTVAAIGDLALKDGSAEEFANCYDKTWGAFKSRTRPVPGNHEFHTGGATPYFKYFGAAAGDPSKGYYSYDLGAWHIIALNGATGPPHGIGPRKNGCAPTWNPTRQRVSWPTGTTRCSVPGGCTATIRQMRDLWRDLYEVRRVHRDQRARSRLRTVRAANPQQWPELAAPGFASLSSARAEITNARLLRRLNPTA